MDRYYQLVVCFRIRFRLVRQGRMMAVLHNVELGMYYIANRGRISRQQDATVLMHGKEAGSTVGHSGLTQPDRICWRNRTAKLLR
jgi:hypothetical protein